MMRVRTSATVRSLFVLLACRLVFHAFYVPVFEGPDEPFHLGRAAVFADDPWREGLFGDRLPGTIVSSIRAHPCCPSLAATFGCPPFRGHGGFNTVAADLGRGAAEPIVNYEAHQPPVFYAATAPLLVPIRSPVARILAMRLVSVFLVLVALAIPMRRLASNAPESVRVATLLFLLLPGAAEALARASNDAAVFLWTAVIVERLCARSRPFVLILLIAVGPLLKLTAFPVVAVAVITLWVEDRRRAAVVGSLASLSVVGVQVLRGWSWGGTYELNRVPRTAAPVAPFAMGLLRSFYTFGKTIFWLGEWSVFRAPLILMGLWFAILLALLVRQFRCARADARRFEIPPSAHAAGAVVAAAGVVVIAVLNARLFGQWGGLGGWYVWAWLPWLVVALRPALEGGRLWMACLASFVILANVCWFSSAFALYGL